MFTDAAHSYAALGWQVFPLRPGTNGFFSKEDDRQATSTGGNQGGFYWATSDVDKISEWGNRWPAANIALRTGEASSVVVLDMDFGKAGSNTQEAIDRLASKGFIFPAPNVIARTPSGGTHWYFRYVAPLGSSASQLGKTLMGKDENGRPRKSFIDVRADGGLAVLAPTLVDGKGRYTWQLPPWDEAGRPKRLLPLPRWVVDQLKTEPPPLRTYVPPVRASLGEIPDFRLRAIAEEKHGSRNAALYLQAARMADWGHATAEIEERCLEAAVSSGLDVKEARATIAQALLPQNRKAPKAHAPRNPTWPR